MYYYYYFFLHKSSENKNKKEFFKKNNLPNRKCFKRREKKNTTKTGVDLILSALNTQVSYLPLADNQNSESALSESEQRQQSGKYV